MTEAPFPGLERALTAEDVDFLYALVLGRPPESPDARARWLAQDGSAAALLADLLASEEFREVSDALRFDRGLGGRFRAPLGPVAARWAREAFGASAASTRSWLSLLLRLHDPGDLRVPVAPGAFDAPAVDAAVIAEVELFDGDRIEGWALDLIDPDRALRLEVWIDGRFTRVVAPDRFRRDLQDRYGGGGRVGFDATVPLAAESRGRPLRLELRTVEGRSLARARGVAAGAEEVDGLAALRAELEGVRAALRRIEAALPDVRARTAFTLAAWDDYARVFYGEAAADAAPRGAPAAGEVAVRVQVRAGSGSAQALGQALRSLTAQRHARWTARLAENVLAERGRTQGLIDSLADDRIGGSGQADAAPGAGADLVVFMSADDVLAPDALACFAQAFAEPARPAVIYADDDRRRLDAPSGEAGVRTDPRLKPPFDPYLLLQGDFIGAVHAIDAALLREAPELFAAGDHARLLATARAAGRERVRHLARVLSHRTAGATPSAPAAAAVSAHLLASSVAADVEPHADVVGAPLEHALRLRGRVPEGASASVIIATRDRVDLLRPCVESLLASRPANRTAFEILVVDNAGVEPESAAYLQALAARDGVRVLRDPAPFNWAAINTRAAAAAGGEVLVFLNDDTAAISPDWCDELVFWALQPRVGAVGARLLYADGTIQHAGVVLGRHGSAVHEGIGEPGGSGGYLGRRKLVHAASAVTGACLATRAEVFRGLGGFDAGRFGVAFNDMDYCLRLGEAGLDCVYTPHATFHHYESQSRGLGDAFDREAHAQAHEELASFRTRHAAALARDPWVNPHFEPQAAAFTLLAPPPARP